MEIGSWAAPGPRSSSREARIEELEEELAAAQERIRELEAALAGASAQQENAEPAQADVGLAGRLEWTGDDDNGYLARALAEDIAYTVVRVTCRGCEHFEARIITDAQHVDFSLSVKRLVALYGRSLTRDDPKAKGQLRTIDPVPTVAEVGSSTTVASAPFNAWALRRNRSAS